VKGIIYRRFYKSPAGFSDIVLQSDGKYLTGLDFSESSEFFFDAECGEEKLPVLQSAIEWLDAYFGGSIPDFTPEYRITGLTPFRKEVLDAVLDVPYGKTESYGAIAKRLAQKRGIPRMSSRAVGGAVGRNPIAIIIPCHRIIGAGGALTGYGGGIENKIALLALEGGDITKFKLPRDSGKL